MQLELNMAKALKRKVKETPECKVNGDIGSPKRLKSNEIEAETDEALIEDNHLSSAVTELGQEPKDETEKPFSEMKISKALKWMIEDSKSFCKSLIDSSEQRETLIYKCEEFVSTMSDDEEKERTLMKLNKSEFIPDCDGNVFKTLLKYGMREQSNGENGYLVVKLLNALFSLYSSDGLVLNPILGIQMIISHSNAEIIFLEHFIKKEKHSEDEPEYLFSIVKQELLKLWLTLVQSFSKVSKRTGTKSDKKILVDSLPYLMQLYGGTLSPSDTVAFEIFQFYCSKKLRICGSDSMPMWGSKCFQSLTKDNKTFSNPILAHSLRANKVLLSIEEERAFRSSMFYQDRKNTDEYYDLRFFLPLICHALDESNVCDGTRVINHGWIYFITRGLSLPDEILRNIAFLSYQRLIDNLALVKDRRLQDVKVWMHFLNIVKNGIRQQGKCEMSNLLSSWITATWYILQRPNHKLYKKLTTFLLAKPILELSIVPDFISFYNACDGNKDTREWMLEILLQGLKSTEDWKIAQKMPTIKFLCCSFSLENILNQRKIVNILSEGAKRFEIALDMIDKHSVLLWISNVSIVNKTYKRELEDVFKFLWTSTNGVMTTFRLKLFQYVAYKHEWSHLLENLSKL